MPVTAPSPTPPPLIEEIYPAVDKAPHTENLTVKPKKEDIIEKAKKQTRIEKPPEKKPEEKLPEEKKIPPNLQEALEEIRKKAALEEIQKKVARRERVEKVEERPRVTESKLPIASTSKSPPRSESKLNEYYSLVWAKIKESWTIPENLLKETIDLEAVIVIIIEKDGKVRRMWFEKKSSNPVYDQMAMRAIMKAEPLPPIPKEISETNLEIGIRFLPE
jgi:colicin import membrane protein